MAFNISKYEKKQKPRSTNKGQWLYVREMGDNDYPKRVLERNSVTGKTRVVKTGD